MQGLSGWRFAGGEQGWALLAEFMLKDTAKGRCRSLLDSDLNVVTSPGRPIVSGDLYGRTSEFCRGSLALLNSLS